MIRALFNDAFWTERVDINCSVLKDMQDVWRDHYNRNEFGVSVEHQINLTIRTGYVRVFRVAQNSHDTRYVAT
jgi:hypothetical protein